ncbi:hypothetical protein IMCC3317_02640 [Kordia antarctica]|uniref:Cytochrome C and Quinol oxidase polypeptide I n=1 Tax=Kordia antarctica TaxID=1218801 RepID=A0A7L4ZEF6_9FLAO|nr:cbb3-type cytochrome c oxidase subunit I [Kordia antarctica]QHI34919.1 hypothetical protein IMCC3317_02640 [Kordia antarctica]
MNLLIKKPHIIFLVFAIIAFSVGFNADGGIDINIHDTYFVISNYHLTTLISIFFGIIGSIYWIMEKVNRKLSKRLNLIHIILTFGGIFLIIILNEFFRKSVMEYRFNENLTTAIYFIAVIVILGQLIFPINVISGFLKKQNSV